MRFIELTKTNNQDKYLVAVEHIQCVLKQRNGSTKIQILGGYLEVVEAYDEVKVLIEGKPETKNQSISEDIHFRKRVKEILNEKYGN